MRKNLTLAVDERQPSHDQTNHSRDSTHSSPPLLPISTAKFRISKPEIHLIKSSTTSLRLQKPCYTESTMVISDHIFASSTMNNSNRSSAAFAISSQNSLFGISFLEVMVYMRRSERTPLVKCRKIDEGGTHRRTQSCKPLQIHSEQLHPTRKLQKSH